MIGSENGDRHHDQGRKGSIDTKKTEVSQQSVPGSKGRPPDTQQQGTACSRPDTFIDDEDRQDAGNQQDFEREKKIDIHCTPHIRRARQPAKVTTSSHKKFKKTS
jgi:hypothetical protein